MKKGVDYTGITTAFCCHDGGVIFSWAREVPTAEMNTVVGTLELGVWNLD